MVNSVSANQQLSVSENLSGDFDKFDRGVFTLVIEYLSRKETYFLLSTSTVLKFHMPSRCMDLWNFRFSNYNLHSTVSKAALKTLNDLNLKEVKTLKEVDDAQYVHIKEKAVELSSSPNLLKDYLTKGAITEHILQIFTEHPDIERAVLESCLKVNEDNSLVIRDEDRKFLTKLFSDPSLSSMQNKSVFKFFISRNKIVDLVDLLNCNQVAVCAISRLAEMQKPAILLDVLGRFLKISKNNLEDIIQASFCLSQQDKAKILQKLHLIVKETGSNNAKISLLRFAVELKNKDIIYDIIPTLTEISSKDNVDSIVEGITELFFSDVLQPQSEEFLDFVSKYKDSYLHALKLLLSKGAFSQEGKTEVLCNHRFMHIAQKISSDSLRNADSDDISLQVYQLLFDCIKEIYTILKNNGDGISPETRAKALKSQLKNFYYDDNPLSKIVYDLYFDEEVRIPSPYADIIASKLAKEKEFEHLEQLINTGVELDESVGDALCMSAKYGKISTIECLLANGHEFTSDHLDWAMYYAEESNNKDMVEFLEGLSK